MRFSNTERVGRVLFAALLIPLTLFASTEQDQAKPGNINALSKSEGVSSIFILDASGSMWGQINGKPKITIAKEVMTKLVSEFPQDGRIGLIAYGHRRKDDCSDVQTLVKLGSGNQQAVLDSVKELNAKGRTPLTISVGQAVELLRAEESASTVVLVSDGIESCDGDPCAAVKAAKASGVNFILHTVGFGMSKEDSAQLQCMAKAGGGEYFQANNAEELLKSTRKALKSKGPGGLKLTLRSNGKPVNAWVKLVGDGSIGLADLTNDTGVKPGHIWHLKSGVYRLETYPAGMHGIDPVVVDNIKIESGKMVDKQLDFDQSDLLVRATNNGQPAVVQIKVINLANNQAIFDTATFSTFTMNGVKSPYEVKLMPGKYQLEVKLPTRSDLAPYTEIVDVSEGGKKVEKDIDIKTSTLRIVATNNGKTTKARIYADDLTANRNIFNSDFLESFGLETPYDITVTPGRYRLKVALASDAGASPHSEELEIAAGGGEVVEKNISFEVKPINADVNGMEQDTDRPGADYGHIIPAAADPALCQKACQDDAQCKAWTYVKPNTVQGPSPNCWLKHIVPAANRNSCCVSGTKPDS